ncbi:hypothetical protein [Xanthobacter flavus]|uniref:hypothetical protein n=1 Tax=Xanthobacter flavus TaxID=281 RepID=UPI0037287E2C
MRGASMLSLGDAIRLYHAAVGDDTRSKRTILYVFVALLLSFIIFVLSRFSRFTDNFIPVFDWNRSFFGQFINIDHTGLQAIDFIIIFLVSLIFTHIIITLAPAKDKKDVYSPIRTAISGNWHLNMINFNSDPTYSIFSCDLNLYISKNTEKLRAKFYNSNQLNIICNVLSVAITVSDESTIELQIIADQLISHDDKDKTFKYFIHLRGADNADGAYPHFQGNWYMLESLGDGFGSRGVANMIRQGAEKS